MDSKITEKTKKSNIILASQSPARKKLLNSLKIPFTVIPPQVDEEVYKKKIKDPKNLCQTLARLKAESIQKKNCWIIGSDQIVYLEGRIFGKPENRLKAMKTLSLLQGKTHQLMTALHLQRPEGSYFEELIINKMSMRPLTQKQIEFYLDQDQDQPFACAGSYTIEKRGITLFEKIDSPDFNAIIGLPLISLCSQLKPWNPSNPF